MGGPGRLRRQGAWRGQAQARARRDGAGWAEGCVRVRLPAGQGGARRGKAGQGRPGLGGAVAQGEAEGACRWGREGGCGGGVLGAGRRKLAPGGTVPGGQSGV